MQPRPPGARQSDMPSRAAVQLVGLVALLATVGCSHDATADTSVRTPESKRPSVVAKHTPTAEGHNRALAAAEAARVLATIPVPPGATKSDSAPVRRLRHLGVYAEPVDPSLTRTNWWVVPLPYRDLVAWYGSHSPADLASAYGPSSSSPEPDSDLYWKVPAGSAAYSSPAAVVSYERLGPNRTAIRTDATLAARYDRTATTLVPATVTSIDVTKSAIDGPPRPPTTETLTDPSLLMRVTSAFDHLDGATAHVSMACGSPVGIVYAYSVTFRWPDHTLAVDPGSPLCGIGMGLTLDGTKLPQALEDDGTLATVLHAALDAS
jgi:hypothetical protein